MKASSVARAYTAADMSSKTEGRPPAELIVLLLDKACACLRRSSMLPIDSIDGLPLEERLNLTEDFHKNTGKAMQIIVALRELLDMENGGELSFQLHDTYTAITNTIWNASKSKNIDDLGKMLSAITELRSAWETVASS